MSFPNIPDINPYINITFDDAINLLLTSIAMEEISLSKLMDAETNKILYVLDRCKHVDCKHYGSKQNDTMLKDALEINKSVDNTLKDMIKLQMLLQFKLDNIKEFLPCTSSTTTTSTSTSTTTTCTKTTTHTTTCTTSTCSTTTKKECCASLSGIGKGCVINPCDEFYNHIAALYAFIFSSDIKNRTIGYSVGSDVFNLHMRSTGYNVKIQHPIQCTDKLVVYGKGYAEKHVKCKPDISGNVDFVLTVCKKAANNLEFRMEIKSETNPKLNHDSGFVLVKRDISNLCLIICC